MPAAARVTDRHECPTSGHGRAKDRILPDGEPSVLIGGKPAARAGDSAECPLGAAVIEQGEPTVLIGNQEAARLGDPMEHGGHVATGFRTVMIGSALHADALRKASKTGTALTEKHKPTATKGAPAKSTAKSAPKATPMSPAGAPPTSAAKAPARSPGAPHRHAAPPPPRKRP